MKQLFESLVGISGLIIVIIMTIKIVFNLHQFSVIKGMKLLLSGGLAYGSICLINNIVGLVINYL